RRAAVRRATRSARSVHDLCELARTVALRHVPERHRRDPRRHAGAAELLVTFLADRLRREHRRLQVIARIELRRILGEETADRPGHRKADVGVDVHLAHAVPDALANLVDRYAVGLLHVATERA